MRQVNPRPKKRRLRRTSPPALRFSPYAWAKLLYLRDRGPTEIGGFGTSAADNLLLVEDFWLVRQSCSVVSVRFDDAAVADYFEHQVDCRRQPQQFARLWLHTHPGSSAEPSLTDEETFARCFGSADWAVMFILARGGRSYARLRFSAGPGGELLLPVEIGFSFAFPASDHAAWDAEYQRSVVREGAGHWGRQPGGDDVSDWLTDWDWGPRERQEKDLGPLTLSEGSANV